MILTPLGSAPAPPLAASSTSPETAAEPPATGPLARREEGGEEGAVGWEGEGWSAGRRRELGRMQMGRERLGRWRGAGAAPGRTRVPEGSAWGAAGGCGGLLPPAPLRPAAEADGELRRAPSGRELLESHAPEPPPSGNRQVPGPPAGLPPPGMRGEGGDLEVSAGRGPVLQPGQPSLGVTPFPAPRLAHPPAPGEEEGWGARERPLRERNQCSVNVRLRGEGGDAS